MSGGMEEGPRSPNTLCSYFLQAPEVLQPHKRATAAGDQIYDPTESISHLSHNNMQIPYSINTNIKNEIKNVCMCCSFLLRYYTHMLLIHIGKANLKTNKPNKFRQVYMLEQQQKGYDLGG